MEIDPVHLLSRAKEKGQLQNQLIKGIVSLAKIGKEDLLAQYFIFLSQRIDNNIELFTFHEQLSLYPHLLREIQPYIGLTMKELQYLSGLSRKVSDLVPTTIEEIIEIDRYLRFLLCPNQLSDHRRHSHSIYTSKDKKTAQQPHRCEARKLRIILGEKEKLIRALMAQVNKLKVRHRIQSF